MVSGRAGRLRSGRHCTPARGSGCAARARANLAQQPLRTLQNMAADYATCCRKETQSGPRYSLTDAVAESPLRKRAAQLGQSTREGAALKAELAVRQSELERRAEWAFDLDKRHTGWFEIDRLQHVIEERSQVIEERTLWAQAAVERESGTREALRQLHGEFDERTQWRRRSTLNSSRCASALHGASPKPLRYTKRKLHALRTRWLYLLGRLRAIRHRTRGSLASRGFIGTLKRAADEFRSGPLLTQPLEVAAPAADFAPFAAPVSTQPRVSIVIPVYNKIEYTVACLRSLVEHSGATPLEIIVVDDASSDATGDHLAQIEGIHVQRNPQNLGFIGSCNAGAKSAKGEFLVFLNNDTVVTAGWLEALLQCAIEEPDAGLIGAKLVYPDGRLQEAGGIVFADGSGWNYGRFGDPNDPRYGFRREADYCSGAAVLLRRELFEQLGGFDTRYALDGFLKAHDVFEDYGFEDLEREREALHRLGF